MLSSRSACRLLARATVLGALTALTSACGGLGPGDSLIFRVAFDEVKQGADCFPGGEIPESIRDDTSNFRNGATLILYVAGDEEALLDISGEVLSGKVDGDNFEFSGTRVDVYYPPGTRIMDANGNGTEDSMEPNLDVDADGVLDSSDPTVDRDNDGLDDRSEFTDDLVDLNMDGEDDRFREIPSGITMTDTRSLNISMTVDGSTVSGAARTAAVQECATTLPTAMCPEDYNTSCSYSTSFKGIEVEDANLAIGSGSPIDEPTPDPNP